MKKKLTAMLLIMSMVCTFLPVSAMAAEAATGNEAAVVSADGSTTEYATLQEAIDVAQDGETVKLLKSVKPTVASQTDGRYVINIEKGITLDGQGHTIDCSSSERGIRIAGAKKEADQFKVVLKNLTATNNRGACHCIGTRGGYVDLTLDKVTIDITKATDNAQALTIGGSHSQNMPVTIKNSTITTNNAGYGIVTFNPVDMTIENSNITGYAGIYLKGPLSSIGTTGSNVIIKDGSVIKGYNPNAGNQDNFGAIVFEDDNIHVDIQDAIIIADAVNMPSESIALFSGYYASENGETSPRAYNCSVSFGSKSKVQVIGEQGYFVTTNKHNTNTIDITGGTFTKDGVLLDVSEYLPDNLTQNADGTVVPMDATNAVAQVGSTYYKSLASAVEVAQKGDTVTLLKDTELDADLKVKASMTINCGNATVETNGHKFLVENGADVILNAKNGGIKNTTAATSKTDLKSMLCVSEGGTLTIQDGNYSTKAAQLILSNGKVIIENGKFVCDAEDIASNAVINEKVAFNISGEKASLIFKNGSLQADVGTETHYMLYGIYAQSGASLVLGNEDGTGPTVKSIEPPIGLNNTTSAPAVDITVNGGTYQSRVDAPQSYEQFNGVFYLSGACNVVINNGNFAAAHPSNQYNHIISIPYKNVAANVTIKNGSFSSSSSIVFEGTKVASVETGAPSVNISGGIYSSDVTKYCVEGLMAQLQGNQYVIVEVPIVDVEVEQETIAAEPEVSIDSDIPQDKKDDAQKVAESVAPAKSDSIAPQLSENTQKAETSNAVSKLEANGLIKIDEQGNITAPTGGDVTVTVVREAYFDVRAVALKNDAFILNITLKYNLLATTDENLNDGLDESKTVTIAQGKASKVSGDVKISVQLPENFANNGDTIFVQHKGYEYKATVSEKNGELIATFTNPHGFSEFTFSKTSQAVATIGSQSYTSLQAAVDAVKDGETIALTAENKENVTVGREVSFNLDTTNGAFNGKMEAGNGFNLTQNGNIYTVTKVSTGGGVVTRYDVTLADTDNGSITATHKRASKNSTVTITAIPDEGYAVDAVTVTEKDGDKVEVAKKDDNKYIFKMPASDVTVKATFKATQTEPEQPSGLPFTDVAKDAWYFPAVEYVFNNGLMNGTTATTFAPNVELNRAMMAAVLYNMEGKPACDKSGLFSDVADGKWYTDAVNWAASNNIVSGMPDGTYAPNQALTREQMASILYRYAEYKGIDVSARADLSTFTDGTTVSPWAQDVVQWAVAEKLINGVGTELQPKGTASRAQVATVLMNYSENVAK